MTTKPLNEDKYRVGQFVRSYYDVYARAVTGDMLYGYVWSLVSMDHINMSMAVKYMELYHNNDIEFFYEKVGALHEM